MADKLLTGLNPEQRLAVTTTEGPVLVVAGAGSGKTSVLTRRIAYLIEQRQVPVHHILAITFTNKAAKEMKERVRALVGAAADDLWMGTFHSMCVRILRREAERIGYPPTFTILDSEDQQALVQQSMLDANYDLKKFDSRAVQAVISQWKNALVRPGQAVPKKRARSQAEAVAADVFEIYQDRLFAAGAMDFDDLIGNTVHLLRQHADVREKYQDKFRYIHVDEYQDTNHAQYQLVRLFAEKYRNICVVGDSDQAIYAWRGADIRNILEFERDYPDATVITLETNYRSTAMILDTANALIRNNRRRKEKTLRSVHGQGDPVVVCALTDGEDEARYVADQILAHVQNGGQYGDCAVLYRANAQSRAIEEALMGQAIPYTIVGGLTFYDRREIKDIFAYLRVLTNPRDEISLLRIINKPRRGLGEQTVGKLLEFAHQEGMTLLEALPHGRTAGLSEAAAEAAKELYDTLQELMLWMEGMPVSEYLAEVLHATGYRKMYEESGKTEDQQRLENIDELFTVTRSFDRRRQGTLLEFLAEVSLLSDVDKEKGKPDNSVRLMTLHASKGLEFPVVFMIGLEEGVFPHTRSLDTDEGIEEERNLCYVGITRAMRKLHITYCTERTLFGQTTLREPSRFLAELPPETTERISLTNADLYDWKVGDHVRHPQYGEGVVLAVKAAGGERTEEELEVMFHPSVGLKTFPKRYARPVRSQAAAEGKRLTDGHPHPKR
ncbi:MAG: UvrD-helicase domain-containing protein [Alicyclobacillus herbarius]|uniref:ATP-dependent helicase n=1 Tax=Alicyclobacillus herbarius TaxID=122960 RepID=UPI002355C337|nr:UvrD-helicase domain-containing protein [Alicyclobacillus herbarius]MCL6632194.1 UvrD-helicase domain-containing protein [Alicyclobacillus herbarius]